MDGVLRSDITKDGLDATDVICNMIKKSKHYGQIRVVMLDGITYGGFNVVDIEEAYTGNRDSNNCGYAVISGF